MLPCKRLAGVWVSGMIIGGGRTKTGLEQIGT
jgi:hypothetical protein